MTKTQENNLRLRFQKWLRKCWFYARFQPLNKENKLVKNILRTFQSENVQKLRTAETRPKFIVSYKKKRVESAEMFEHGRSNGRFTKQKTVDEKVHFE